jgi:putative zinc-dependent peptidase DUF5700
MRFFFGIALASAAGFLAPPAPAPSDSRVQLMLDASEAESVLAIAEKITRGQPAGEGDWSRLFSSEPYRRLKEREAKIAEQFHAPSNGFTDEDFRRFVLSAEIRGRAPALRQALDEWKKADFDRVAGFALRYLPATATIHAKIFPVIKPKKNSFVWEASTDPAIFLYLDPAVGIAKFENTVAHELHHIGFASVASGYEEKIARLPAGARRTAALLPSFGEGFAMLAAAGGPAVHPHAVSPPEERARWDRDMENFDKDVATLDRFFLDVLEDKISDPAAIDERASSFYGTQGPWYTVGYRMAVIVEKRFGRTALIDAMLDPRKLLRLYNDAASRQNQSGAAGLPLWSARLIEGLDPAGK